MKYLQTFSFYGDSRRRQADDDDDDGDIQEGGPKSDFYIYIGIFLLIRCRIFQSNGSENQYRYFTVLLRLNLYHMNERFVNIKKSVNFKKRLFDTEIISIFVISK